jgi:hypothetical protein
MVCAEGFIDRCVFYFRMKGNQEWKYDHKVRLWICFLFVNGYSIQGAYGRVVTVSFQKSQLLHKVTNKCLEMTKDGARLQMRPCELSNEYQQWVFKEFDEKKAREHGML